MIVRAEMIAPLIGLVTKLEEGIGSALQKVHELGFPTCQISTYDPSYFTDTNATKILELCDIYNIQITTLWAGWPGKVVWDFIEGPATVGLVPIATRQERCEIMKHASDFATKLHVDSITTHIGFIPENPTDPLYPGLVSDLRDLALYCKNRGQFFCFETGQETPVTLLRTIEDIGEDNVGVNFDGANLILYGKANAVDALSIVGRYVRGVHVKDGLYPTDGRDLGRETNLGEGKVNVPLFLSTLISIGYRGPFTIERETMGLEQLEDIKRSKDYLVKLLSGLTPIH